MRKNIFSRGTQSIPMNLQLFAEEGNGAGTEGEGGGAGEGAGEGAGAEETKPQSFDDILKGEGHQAEFDRRVQKAIAKAQEKWKALTDDKLSEAEKLAKMTKDEKDAYMRQKHEKELQDRETSITRRELMAEAKNTLAEKNLPVELAEVLNYTSADDCSKSMEAVEKAFQKAVEAGVEERLKGGKPLKKAPGEADADLAKSVENLMMGI